VAQAGSRGSVPSADGFAFANAWPAAPAVTVPLLVGSAGIGNAARGLCGGMVFAALDYWHLPAGVARYYRWMLRPDGDSAGAWRRVTARAGLLPDQVRPAAAARCGHILATARPTRSRYSFRLSGLRSDRGRAGTSPAAGW